ncbi:aspartyl protease family protein At5g10770-like [Miscanthus floridulus]|uniref:aspartyl protease family protein At5g10770-like n=1 Tax=Miscanthus floridulus TaxID=154761 RepID=UPI003459867B
MCKESSRIQQNDGFTRSSNTIMSSASAAGAGAAAAPGTLQVVHRSAGKHESASDHVALLHRDQFRVETIHRQHLADSGSATTAESETRLGLPFSSLEYVATIGIGTPERDLTVVLDTGSDLTWVQCQPCSSCYSQNEPMFQPRESITYEEIECADQECFMMSVGTTTCVGTSCIYSVDYGDDSFTSGYLARESITLSPNSTSSDTLTGVLFGCGALWNGGFGASRVAGILGLGQGASSVNLTANPSFYSVELTGIAVAGRSLPIAPSAFDAGTIVDSGTVVTRLPPDAYAALRAEFRRQMCGRYPVAPPIGRVLDTCYDVTGHDEVVVPSVALLFGGGARLDVDASGILLVADVSQACLAFAPNADPGSLSTIGNMQQRAHTMVFDVDGGRVDFGANGCM